MKLHTLPASHKKKQRIGRGGKRGTTAGRGTKGQRSRAGHRIRPAERDLILRLPKQRGFRNKPKTEKTLVLNLDALKKVIASQTKGAAPLELTKGFLKAAGLVGKNWRGAVKLLGNGEITAPISVTGIQVSASVKAKIEKAGGKVA